MCYIADRGTERELILYKTELQSPVNIHVLPN